MKKKIILGVATLAIVTVATINVNMSKNDNQLSALGLANVEALATPETNTPGSNYSCSATYDCGDGSVSCTGDVCKRGTEKGRKYVECDYQKTWC